ncbi:short chain dehydrogenase [Corynebacterium maris DSM 45190]|uniref:Short chain dehydrogenase n=1 Tax=Corynebacterium maris DSM 45190 TaxID=1224163 RepID=S5SR58_9CORY|nr:SDR family oxidoreductase [Corynebacterium maris]AGS33564.1 short chain dehydrogenase [Corynebacterium maris DSM 45190]
MQSIVVTGAAGGLGRAVVDEFLDRGWLVGAYDLEEPDVAEHPNLITGRLDVTDPDAWDAALADFHARAGRIDAVDNNAGLLIDGPLPDADPEKIRQLIEVNATGVTLGARASFEYLRATRGTLVNMASASAIYGQPGIAAYSATKFYVAGLTEALNLEWKKDKVRVVDVWPLWAKTTLADNGAASVKKLGVHITPEDVAEVVWAAVNPPTRWARGKVHYGVSRLDRLMYLGRSLATDRMAKNLTRLLAG